ncbi:MAG: MGH1-like glycoside hydrolase domain-containing protein, partial [bacterium]
MNQYDELKKKIASGWNTWNTRSVLSHVHLPESFAINLGFKEFKSNCVLKEALIGRFGKEDEIIHPGGHAYDGSYTSLNIKWKDMEFKVCSAVTDGELVLLVEPVKLQKKAPLLIVEVGVLWNRPGIVDKKNDYIEGVFNNKSIKVFNDTKSQLSDDPNVPTLSPYFALILDKSVGISTGMKRSVDEIRDIIEDKKLEYEQSMKTYGELSEAYHAMQTCLAWDTIYEPQKDRVVTPVSRIWNVNYCGYVLFCWDTYFAAYMAFDNKELAYSNAIEITRAITEKGFVPNLDAPYFASTDRSQPPVGSMVVKELYRRYKENWLLEEVYDDLLTWNTWFWNNRRWDNNYMSWGSNSREEFTGFIWENAGVNDTYGAALESGLDNSPMYDDMPFDKERSMMMLADVGLMGLYIMDCNALLDIAKILGKNEDEVLLSQRREAVSKALSSLWDEESGIYLNKNIKTDTFSKRMSPTNFYALFSKNISSMQKKRIIDEHFYNRKEFWGDYIMPSIARNDPAYPDQDYWRGRIWAPLNFLVYLAMRNSDIITARKDLAEKSKELLLKEWRDKGHVHENYNGTTGEGCDVKNSDKFYHWGALL